MDGSEAFSFGRPPAEKAEGGRDPDNAGKPIQDAGPKVAAAADPKVLTLETAGAKRAGTAQELDDDDNDNDDDDDDDDDNDDDGEDDDEDESLVLGLKKTPAGSADPNQGKPSIPRRKAPGPNARRAAQKPQEEEGFFASAWKSLGF